MKQLVTLILTFSIYFDGLSQNNIAINDTGAEPDSSSVLDVNSAGRGMLVPRLTKVQRLSSYRPATGLLVYQTDDISGFYYNAGTKEAPNWIIIQSNQSGWSTNGNSNINPETNFFGTIDSNSLTIKVNNIVSGHISSHPFKRTTFGMNAGTKSVLSITAFGSNALGDNITGEYNTAIGAFALKANTEGYVNTAVGHYAMRYNLTGAYNTAIGSEALFFNDNGNNNTAVGLYSLKQNINGNENVGIGHDALSQNTSGYENTAIGREALYRVTSGNRNTAIGAFAGPYPTDNYNNTTSIGFGAYVTASNQVRIGDLTVTSIGGYANWTNLSDGRFKKDIRENVPGLSFILKLRPVTYHLDIDLVNKHLPNRTNHAGISSNTSNAETEKASLLQTGFIAQEVEFAAKELGVEFSGVDKPKNENDFYGLRYAEFVVPLVKAVQEQQQQINALKMENEALRLQVQKINELEKRLSLIEK